MAQLRTEVGFWHAVGHLRLRDVLTVEFGLSAVLAASLAWFLVSYGSLEDRLAAAGLFVSVVAALVGVVFAGVALVTSLLSDAYLRLLSTAGSGILAFLRPFMLAVGVQVATVIGSVLYVATATRLPPTLEAWLFGILCLFFVGSCLEIVVLTRSVFMHAQLRAQFAKTLADQRDSGSDRG
ncbi:hypothetical protein AB3M83_01790 [Microbacterium sp. 179-B 1A2 NHS]|uniref:hypothetical protein n=1 Tax=Microbacterium sp. 179-B 1A2 NHS TaxID=3142383 RepID=UPI0039A20B38